jgi:ATP-dependent helicase/nuclease subunit B
MDNGIEGDSLIIPARLNKGDQLGRSSAATLLQFDKLRQHVRKLLGKMGDEIYNGNVEINPFRKKQMTACTYCSFLSICQFDTSLKGNRYRILDEIKDDEVWTMLEGNESNE